MTTTTTTFLPTNLRVAAASIRRVNRDRRAVGNEAVHDHGPRADRGRTLAVACGVTGRGHLLRGALLGGVGAVIQITVVIRLVGDLGSVTSIAGYAAGVAFGVVTGGFLDRRASPQMVKVQVITPSRHGLPAGLRVRGWPSTRFVAHGDDEELDVVTSPSRNASSPSWRRQSTSSHRTPAGSSSASSVDAGWRPRSRHRRRTCSRAPIACRHRAPGHREQGRRSRGQGRGPEDQGRTLTTPTSRSFTMRTSTTHRTPLRSRPKEHPDMNTTIRSIATRVILIGGLAGSAMAIVPGVASAGGCTGKTSRPTRTT